jgi:hypothetical protein
VRRHKRETYRLAIEHADALIGALGRLERIATEIAGGGDACPPGAQDMAAASWTPASGPQRDHRERIVSDGRRRWAQARLIEAAVWIAVMVVGLSIFLWLLGVLVLHTNFERYELPWTDPSGIVHTS